MKLEAQTLEKIKNRITEKVMSGSGTWIDWQYLLDASTLLAKCRYTLQYTYPYAYYMEPCPRKELVSIHNNPHDYPRRAKRALEGGEDWARMRLIDSKMAGLNGLKLGGMIEGICENVLLGVRYGIIHDSCF